MADLGAFSRFRPDGPSLASRLGASRFNRGEGARWLYLIPFIAWATWETITLPVVGVSQ